MNFELLLEQTTEIIKEVSSFIETESKHFDINSIEKKGFNDLVSYVDKEAEKSLVRKLSQVLPDAGFIAEEGTSSVRSDEYNWIIDPLDGTTNFTHGLPVYAISVALVHKNDLILGVVNEINRKECFSAIKGQGAKLNGASISVSEIDTLGESLMATGFPYYSFDDMQKYLSILNDLMQSTHGLRRMGSAAVDLAYVACGRFEGFFEYNLNAWDVAAGALIVQEAGGQVSDFGGNSNYLFGREIIAAGPTHGSLLQTIQNRW